MKPAEFDGKNVYVVGGSLGIGLATSVRIASLGSHVAIFARRKELLEQAAGEIAARRRQPDQRVSHYQLDAADHDRVLQVMDTAVAELGPPDVLINCAGAAYPNYFEQISAQQFADTIRTNLHGCWNTVSALVPQMKSRGGGYIVNTASLAGLIGVFGYTDYCAAKFAVVGFSEALRSELKPHGITVSVLCPPDTSTPGFETENKTKPAETRALSANARILSADEVAAALLRGMARRSRLIVPGFEGKLMIAAKRLLPVLVERVMDFQIHKVAGRAAL